MCHRKRKARARQQVEIDVGPTSANRLPYRPKRQLREAVKPPNRYTVHEQSRA